MLGIGGCGHQPTAYPRRTLLIVLGDKGQWRRRAGRGRRRRGMTDDTRPHHQIAAGTGIARGKCPCRKTPNAISNSVLDMTFPFSETTEPTGNQSLASCSSFPPCARRKIQLGRRRRLLINVIFLPFGRRIRGATPRLRGQPGTSAVRCSARMGMRCRKNI
jgi:hypothetical protein